jgi:hypothetical protein
LQHIHVISNSPALTCSLDHQNQAAKTVCVC